MRRRGILIAAFAAAGTALVVIALIVSSGCFGGGTPKVVPEVRGQRLDIAERRLDAIGLGFERSGGGTFGVVVRSRWRVCGQDPRAGVTAKKVLLVVDRECEWAVPHVTDLPLGRAKSML